MLVLGTNVPLPAYTLFPQRGRVHATMRVALFCLSWLDGKGESIISRHALPEHSAEGGMDADAEAAGCRS